MVQNYYSLKLMAGKHLAQDMQFIKDNPDKSIKIAAMAIDFQRLFGFSERTLHKMLEPYIAMGAVEIVNDAVQAVQEVKKE